jgi:hypothetical protein
MTRPSAVFLYRHMGNPSPRNPYLSHLNQMVGRADAEGFQPVVVTYHNTPSVGLPTDLPIVRTRPGADRWDVAALVARIHRETPVGRLFAFQECTVRLGALCRTTCHIPGMNGHVAQNFRDKDVMHRVAEACGIPVARSRPVTCKQDLYALGAEVGWPIVCKPTAAAGAHGFARLDGPKAVERVWPTFAQQTTTYRAEEFIEGPEYYVDALVRGGEICFATLQRYLRPTREFRVHPPGSVIRHHDRTASEEEILRVNAQMLRGLGLTTGIAHAEFFLSPRGVIFSEAAARVGGGHAVPTVEAATGVHLAADWVSMELNPDFTPSPQWPPARHVGGQLLPANAVGRISAIAPRTALQVDDHILDVVHWFGVGDLLSPASRSTRMFGYLLSEGESYDAVALRMTAARERFWVRTDAN